MTKNRNCVKSFLKQTCDYNHKREAAKASASTSFIVEILILRQVPTRHLSPSTTAT